MVQQRRAHDRARFDLQSRIVRIGRGERLAHLPDQEAGPVVPQLRFTLIVALQMQSGELGRRQPQPRAFKIGSVQGRQENDHAVKARHPVDGRLAEKPLHGDARVALRQKTQGQQRNEAKRKSPLADPPVAR